MRTNRLLLAPPVTYRMSSALCDDAASWSKEECRQLVNLTMASAAFCEMELRYVCVWRRGVDMLVHVPVVPELSDEELAAKVALFWPDAHGVRAAAALQGAFGARAAAAARLRLTRFMGSLPMFSKSVKQRWTGQYRDSHGGAGSLWRDRFRSRPVAESGDTQVRMAAAIEMGLDLPWRTVSKPGFQVSTLSLARDEADPLCRQWLRDLTDARSWSAAAKQLGAAVDALRADPGVLDYGVVTGRRIQAHAKDAKMWESNFKRWEQILKKYPDGQLPVDVPDDPLLRHWASQQRMAAGKGDLSQERIDRLQQIGVLTFQRARRRPLSSPSSSITPAWKRNLAEVSRLKKRTGGFTLSGDDRDVRRLRAWMSMQRAYYHEGILPAEKVKALNGIDFDWRPPRGRPRRH